jgi:hypothetical protein
MNPRLKIGLLLLLLGLILSASPSLLIMSSLEAAPDADLREAWQQLWVGYKLISFAGLAVGIAGLYVIVAGGRS